MKHRTWATGEFQRGFTLLEILVVLAIAVLVAAAFPLGFSPKAIANRRLEVSIEKINSALISAQTKALDAGSPIVVRISGESLTFSARPEFNVALPTPVDLSKDKIQIESVPPGSALTFYPDGSSSGGGYDISSGGQRRHLVAGQFTSRIKELNP